MVNRLPVTQDKLSPAILGQANAVQREAADASASVWVSASAGTGKTKVLTDRVLNLLLKGVPPRKILCLTYTKAAATEMNLRLLLRLDQWASLTPESLRKELFSLLGHYPDESLLKRARLLFIEVLYTPGGLNIQTIHSFCQSILQKFPLEASISPHFEIADTFRTQQLLQESLHDLFIAAQSDASLDEKLKTVTLYQSPVDVAEKLQDLLAHPVALQGLAKEGLAAARQKLYEETGLSPLVTEENLKESYYENTPVQALKNCILPLAKGGIEDQQRARTLEQCLEHKHAFTEDFRLYCQAFLTQDGQIRARLASKKAQDLQPGLLEMLEEEAQRIERLATTLKTYSLVQKAGLWMELGLWIYSRYTQKKLAQGLLDYDDLITKTYQLLNMPGLAPFILYKLDGGIHHILVDEAQDTTPMQWSLITALVEEFFSGQGSLTQNTTLFAVGDFKQSIYSFQGAEPHLFQQMRAHFSAKVRQAHKLWRSVDMQISFRSTPPVLAAVDRIFSSTRAQQGLVDTDDQEIRHTSFLSKGEGLVEIWPLVPRNGSSATNENPETHKSEERLASLIALKIRQWLDTPERLAAKGRPVKPGDILVLVQRRTDFIYALIRALKKQKIPSSGLDRLDLVQHIAIQDLMAIGRFLLLPEDDLSLATILKSPVFGFDEAMLFELAQRRRPGKSLWHTLRKGQFTSTSFLDATDFLRRLLKRVDYVSPFSLFADILYAEGGMKKFSARMGPHTHEVLEEFLSAVQDYEQHHEPSLQKFLHWFEHSAAEIKRDLASAELDEVRIMTVHGAKGLQAPVVILADTTRIPGLQDNFLWSAAGYLLPNIGKASGTETLSHLKQSLLERSMAEYRRLLYVALTRAEERLYICGWEKFNGNIDDNCWYQLCWNGLASLGKEAIFDFSDNYNQGWQGKGIRFCQEGESAASDFKAPNRISVEKVPLPSYLCEPARLESPTERHHTASHAEALSVDTPYYSTVSAAQARGSYIHKLLELFPESPPENWHALSMQIAAGYPQLEEAEPLFIQVKNVLKEPAFQHLFGPSSYAEVPLLGTIDGISYSTQIDRLVVEENLVLIIDYKSDLKVPDKIQDVPKAYIQQLDIYRRLVKKLYPDKEIQTFLLWIQKPCLMPIENFSI